MSKQGGSESVTGRVFEIMQYEYNPKTGYKKDGTPRKNAKPLITQEQIDSGLNHKLIKRWAYAWHDKDVYLEADELADPWKVAGKSKPPHPHIVIEAPSKVSVDQLARWFGVPANFVEKKNGRGAFIDCVEYLVHESPKAVEQGKYHYDDDVVVANFDWRAEVNEMQKNREKFGPQGRHLSAAQVMKMHVLQDGWTMRKCRQEDPITYAEIYSKLPGLRLAYLQDQPPVPLRLNYYIDGDGGLGKGTMARYFAAQMFPEVEDAYYEIGNDDRVTFEGYDGQPVIIWHDMRAADFIRKFGRGDTFNLLDTHPGKQTQQKKNSSVILQNAVNIIDGIEPFYKFLDGLAGEYKDREGKKHDAEDKTQAYRRFPLIFNIRSEDFDVMYNRGFLNRSYEYDQYDMYQKVTGSWSDTARMLDGAAKEHTMVRLIDAPMKAHRAVLESHDAKITNIEDIPEKFKHYGETKNAAEVFLDKYFDDLSKGLDPLCCPYSAPLDEWKEYVHEVPINFKPYKVRKKGEAQEGEAFVDGDQLKYILHGQIHVAATHKGTLPDVTISHESEVIEAADTAPSVLNSQGITHE